MDLFFRDFRDGYVSVQFLNRALFLLAVLKTGTRRSASAKALIPTLHSLLHLRHLSCFIRSKMWTVWSREKLSVPILFLPLLPWLALQFRQCSGLPRRLQEQMKCVLWLTRCLLTYCMTLSLGSWRWLDPVQMAMRHSNSTHVFWGQYKANAWWTRRGLRWFASFFSGGWDIFFLTYMFLSHCTTSSFLLTCMGQIWMAGTRWGCIVVKKGPFRWCLDRCQNRLQRVSGLPGPVLLLQ